MTIEYNLAALKVEAEQFPRGPAADILATGKIGGETVFLDDAGQKKIRHRFRPRRQWTYNIEHVQSMKRLFPDGYVEFILSHGKKKGNTVVFGEFAQKHLRLKYPDPPAEKKYPVGFAEFILSRGKIEGEFVVLDEAARQELQAKFFPRSRNDLAPSCSRYRRVIPLSRN